MAKSVSESASTSARVLRTPERCHGAAGRIHPLASYPQAGAVARWALRLAPRRKVHTP